MSLVARAVPQRGRRILRHAGLTVGAALTAVVVLVALVSLVWTPQSATAIDVAHKLAEPSAVHWLGTDHFGRDIASMLMVGAQNSIMVGIVAVSIGVGLGVACGLVAAARGGWVEEALMRLADFTFAFPAVLSAILITALLGPGALNSIIAIGIFNVPAFARLSRGAARGIWVRDFILAARAAGKGKLRITIEHVLPNIASLLIVQATIQFGVAILAEAGLSYLGLGTQPPNPSWGRMLNEAQTFLFIAPRLAIYPGLAIVLAVLGVNLLGDGLRDVFDPRLMRRR
jgi:peptide/nickel transport system permease protein